MTNITIIKDTDETLVQTFEDYDLSENDTGVFKFARNFGDAPIVTITGKVDVAENTITYDIPRSLTASMPIDGDVEEYVYEIECILSGQKKAVEQGNLYIHNTI